ncbi:Transmembrane and coiled-coil domain-containing protein 4 [Myotis brandtii]|uniref:Transmembrane and coiled-coil domain-containing protein 4 n=1 Tax=Myotis brandtii TaxID=109478 RepID=S7QAR8_MYOBR|nr:Transmembrane and coiled-coil domain-containing protein 4 [Myotis brandtii]
MKSAQDINMKSCISQNILEGRYDARARVLICHVTSLLHLPVGELDLLEETFLESLKETKEEESETAEASRKKRENRKKWKRYLLIGLATVGGGTVIGVTGGLAAPLIAAGAATIIGSAGAAALGSVAGIAVMTSLFGAAGASLTGYKMKKRVGAIEEFTFLPLTEGRQLHITIAITGWLASGKYRTFSAPWAALARSCEQYCLAWEAKYLMELGNALETILSGLANIVAQEALKYTVLSGITAALTWPASLLSVANIIDNPWGVCLHRSAEVGKHLAHILLSRQQGRRPVTLIGFSLGARVIYFCLQEMAQEKDCQGIIEDVVLLGAPVEGEAKHWEPFRKVVSGRIINGYSRLIASKAHSTGRITREADVPSPGPTGRLEVSEAVDCQGIIEDVVLLGAPVEGEAKHWEPFRKVVSGRIINGYSRGDWLLSFVYRTSSAQLQVAGLQPVLLQDRRMENVDLSSVVSGHLDYGKQMDVILKAVGIPTKPGWGEKGLLMASGNLPQEEPRQAAAASSSDKTTDPDGQTQGPAPRDTSQVSTSADPSQAQVPMGLDQPKGASLPAAACPAENPQTCSHGVSPNPLGCPSCASEIQGPGPGQD